MPTVREFFLAEANNAVQRLSVLLQAADGAPGDAGELHRLSRTLRGSAQMAQEERAHRVAAALEAAAHALATGTLVWSQDFGARARQTVADLRALIGGTDPEPAAEARAAAAVGRWSEIGIGTQAPAAPAASRAADGMRGAAGAGVTREFRDYAARELDALLAELDAALRALERDPYNRDPLKNILRRQQALLGATQVEELPLVSETLRTVNEVTRLVARSKAAVEGEWLDVYRAARDIIAAAAASRAGGVDPAGERALERLRSLRTRIARRYGAEGEVTPAPPRPAVPEFLTEPVRADDVVSIENLCYRGEAALRRALELQPLVEQAVPGDAAAREAVDELFDLIRLGLE